MKKPKKDSVEIAPPSRKKFKRFNLKEELIDSGWEKPKKSGYQARVFGFFQGFIAFLALGSLIWLNMFRGFFNFTVAGLSAVPLIVLGIAAVTLGEFMFYFIFLHGRHKKLDFIKETVPYKIMAYIIGGITALISPIAAIIAVLIIPFMVNHAFANWATRENFDRRARYYEPHKYVEPGDVEYEEPVHTLTPPKLKRPQKGTQDASLSADINGPQVSAFGPKELQAHHNIQTAEELDSEFDDMTLLGHTDIANKVSRFLEKYS